MEVFRTKKVVGRNGKSIKSAKKDWSWRKSTIK